MIAVDLRIVLIPTACASLILVATGFLVFRRLSGALSIPWPDQELIVAVHTRHLIELLASSVLAGTTLYFMVLSHIFGESPDGVQIGAYEAELICGAGLAVLLLSLRWFAERLVLRRSHYTIGYLLGRDPGFFRRGITCQFFDNNHERRGGRGPLWGRAKDNAVLVLYDPKDPDSNVAHGGFLFHRFAIFLIPSRKRQKVQPLDSDTKPLSEQRR